MTRIAGRSFIALVLFASLATVVASAAEDPHPQTPALAAAPPSLPPGVDDVLTETVPPRLMPAEFVHNTPPAAEETESDQPLKWFDGIVPTMPDDVRAWLAVLIILMLTIRLQPFGSLRNLDGIVLAAVAVLLLWRAPGADPDSPWPYAALTVAALYWLIRGIVLFTRPAVRWLPLNVNGSATLVLMVAGLLLAGDALVRAPLTRSSRDAVVGGAYFVRTGQLPYGSPSGAHTQAPLLYLAHAGAVKLVDLSAPADDRIAALDPEMLPELVHGDGADIGRRVTLIVNGGLLALFLLGLGLIGAKLHSSEAGAALVAMACLFPGSFECFAEPEIMLPTVLVTWSALFALFGGLGGFCAMVLIMFGTLSWPWVWVLVPVVLAYLLARGWQAVGSLLGVGVAAIACAAGIIFLVQPAPPRTAGALRAAGMTPTYTAELVDGGLIFEHRDEAPSPVATFLPKRLFWQLLLYRDGMMLGDVAHESLTPNGADLNQITWRDVDATGDARARLVEVYRAALANAGRGTRFFTGLRTLAEATWLPPALPPERVFSPWIAWELGTPREADGPGVRVGVRRAGAWQPVAMDPPRRQARDWPAQPGAGATAAAR